MDKDLCIKVGWVKEPHGLKGDLYIKLLSRPGNLKLPEWSSSVSQYYLAKESMPLSPYSFISMKPHKEGLLVKVEGVNNRNLSDELKGSALYIKKEDIKSEPGESIYLVEILGFTVLDNSKNKIGEIKNFSTASAQDLIVVKTDDGLFDVPWVDAFIETIDFENKTVIMNLPEGLLSEI